MFSRRHQKALAKFALTAFFIMATASLWALSISNRYRSPRNPERQVRKSTTLIILHTTEAPAKSSLNKVSSRGECHYVVTEEGNVYAIVDRDKEAFHAGRSMWHGKEDVDKYSVGIECVGYHNKPMGIVQLRAIKDLISSLKSMYRLNDNSVICHSHVAYGAPNKWYKKKHRGRKRCAMLFATPSVRRELGLYSRPKSDIDVRAGRLIVADKYLNTVLYGSIDPMSRHYPQKTVKKAAPKVTAKVPVKPAVKPVQKVVPKLVPNVSAVATPKKVSKVVPKMLSKASRIPTSEKDLKEDGWTKVGVVKKGGTIISLAGSKWNKSDTYYTIGKKVISGDKVNPAKIQVGTSVWLKK